MSYINILIHLYNYKNMNSSSSVIINCLIGIKIDSFLAEELKVECKLIPSK